MKKTKTIGKKSLSIVLALIMCFGMLTVLPSVFVTAASVKDATKSSGDLTFIVPETIYLEPKVDSWTNSTTAAFQYYVNNTSTGGVKNSLDKTGYIYYSFSGASSATLSYKFYDAALSSSLSGSVTLSSSTISSGSSVSITGGTSPSLSAATSGCYVEWCLSYTDSVDGIAKKAYAYSYIYKPYTLTVQGLCRTKDTDGLGSKYHGFAQSIGWISGFHSISGEGTYYARYTSEKQFAAFLSADTGTMAMRATTVNTSQRYLWTLNGTPMKNAFYNTSGTSYFYVPGASADCGSVDWFDTSNSGTFNKKTGTYSNKEADDTNKITVANCTAKGVIYIDTSRYTNLNQIPNLGVGLMVTDSEQADGNTAYWRVADMTGVTNNFTGSYYSGSTNVNNVATNCNTPIIAGCGTGRDNSNNGNDDCGVYYTGTWVCAIDGDASSKDYVVKTYYCNENDDEFQANAQIMTMTATQVNKGALRTAVLNATKAMAKMGVNGSNAGVLTSAYFDANDDYGWSAFRTAYKNAVIGLTKLDSSCNASSLASSLESAMDGLKTSVSFNANGGSYSGSSTVYVDVGTTTGVNTSVSYTNSSTPSKTGYSFSGWSTNQNATSGNTTITTGYNQTWYAVWTPITYTVAYNGNGATGGSTASQTFTYDTATAFATNGFTKTGYSFDGWTNELVNDTATYSYDNTSGTNYHDFKQYTINAPFAEGDVYVLECDAKGSGTFSNFFYGASGYLKVYKSENNYGVTTWGSDGNNTIPESSEYKHYIVTFTLGSTGDGSVNKYLLFRAQAGANVSVKNIRFGKLQGATGINLTSTQGATVTMYAKWKPISYTVAYNGNGATGGSTASSSHTYDLSKALTANGFTRAYSVTYNANGGTCSTGSATATYTFNGWNTNSDGTGTSYTNQQSVSNLTSTNGGTVNLYAKWTSASVTLPTATKTYDSTNHYSFDGWYTAASGGTKVGAANASYTPAASTTLYAQYTGTEHTFDDVVQVSAPSCTVPGSTKYTCACGYNYTDTTTPGVIAHTPVEIPASSPTCTATGNNKYYQCSVCHNYFSNSTCTNPTTPADQTLAALGHNMQAIAAVTATCAAEGNNAYYKCTRCNNFYKDSEGVTPTTVAAETIAKNPSNHAGGTEIRNVVSATCTNAGYTGDTYCLGCGVKLSDGTTIEQLSHSYRDGWITTVAANCVETGERKCICSNCGYTETETVVINPANHKNLVDDAAVPATCTETGLTAGKHCAACNTVTQPQTTVPALNHNFETYTYNDDATCTEDGTETAQCTRCDATDTRTKTGTALDHDLENHAAQAPDCVNPGWNAYQSCTRCDYTTKVEIPATGHTPGTAADCTNDQLCLTCGNVITPRLGHNWGDATCTEPSVCTRCGVPSGEAIGHDFTEQIIDAAHLKSAANCTEAAVYYYDCSRCNVNAKDEDTSKTFSYGVPNGHTEVPVEAVPATCTQSGLTAGVRCSVCEEILTEQTVVPKLGHNFDDTIEANVTVVPATCLVDGSKTVKCSRCDETDVTVLNHPGHTPETIPAVAPSCLNAGSSEGVKCSVCNEVLTPTAVIPATGHTETPLAAVPATCIETGLTEGVWCPVCETVLVPQEETALAEHTPAEAVEENVVRATCSAEGSCEKVVYCSFCGGELSRTPEVIEKKAHTPVKIPAISPSCTATGLTEGSKCAICGEILVPQEVSVKLGHDYRDRITVPASCSQEGTTIHTCRRCGDTYTETVAKLEHNPGAEARENVVAATCTSKGSYNNVIRCTFCREILSSEHVITDFAAHTEVAIPAVPATCRETGLTEGIKCSRCGQILVPQEEIAKTTHNAMVVEDKAPTCTEEGFSGKVVCSFCGIVLVQPDISPATGHTWGEWVTKAEATASSDGYKERACENCGVTERMVISLGEQRLVKFYVFQGMYYMVNGKKISSTANIYTYLGEEVRFTVVTAPGNMFAGYTICADGVEIQPDSSGVYTIPAGVNNVIVTATGLVEVNDNSGSGSESGSGTGKSRLSFWEWLIMIFKKIAALFTGGR